MLLVTTAAMLATGPGQTVIVSEFKDPIASDLGLSETQMSAAYMVGTVAASLPLVLIGWFSDRVGPRKAMMCVAVAFGAACVLAGQALGLVTLTLAFFGLRFLGQGALGLVSGHALAMWFERRLGTMNGLKMMGAQLGFAAMPIVVAALIVLLGWRHAYAALGVAVVVVVVPMAWFIARDRPEMVGQRIDGDPLEDQPGHEHDDESEEFDPTGHLHVDPAFTLFEAAKTRAFWILSLAMSLSGLIGTGLIFHTTSMLCERGVEDPVGSGISAGVKSVWSLTMMATVFPAGWLADRIAARVLLPLSVLLLAMSAALPLIFLAGTSVLYAMMAMFALSQSAAMGVGAPAVARYFGRAHHGAIRSCTMLLGVAGTGLGPVMLGWSLDETGSSRPGLIGYIALCVPIFFGACFLKRPSSKL
jgi:OFA family oxalate/formate antiporter-like MFS transporter